MKTFWRWVKSIPVGVWAALSAAVTVLGLYLRGRRLEGELARAKVAAEAARLKADLSGASAHAERAAQQRKKILQLEKMRAVVITQSAEDRRNLSAMSPAELDDAYLRLAREKSLPGD